MYADSQTYTGEETMVFKNGHFMSKMTCIAGNLVLGLMRDREQLGLPTAAGQSISDGDF